MLTTFSMPRRRRHIQDEDDAEQAKDVALGGMKRRDELTLELLKMEGFLLACLPLVGPPPDLQLDFSAFIPKLDGIPNLVVSAPSWTPEQVHRLFEQLPHRRFEHGTAFQVIDSFDPAADDWFPQVTPITYLVHVFAAHGQAADYRRWAHCATIRIEGAGTESKLRVIHVGVGHDRNAVLLDFLIPHSLRPRRLLL